MHRKAAAIAGPLQHSSIIPIVSYASRSDEARSEFASLCLDVLHARDFKELVALLLKGTTLLEFERISCFAAIDRVGEPTIFVTLAANTPAGYLRHFLDTARNRLDPVLQRAKVSHRPFLWGREHYARDPDMLDRWEEQAPFGYGAGASSALHTPDGRHLALNLCTTKPPALNEPEKADLLARVHFLCTHVYESSMRLLGSSLATQTSPIQLSRREIDCLQWTLAGKTAWEVGQIVHLSERTVSGILSAATKKLGCVSKHQAALRALQCGWLRL